MNTRTRFLREFSEDTRELIDEHSLAKAYMREPESTNAIMTFIMGNESDDLPLTFLTEGQDGGVETIEGVEYTWDVYGEIDPTDSLVAHSYLASDKPGVGNTMVYIVMKTNKFKRQHTITSPSGIKCRIQTDGIPHGTGTMYGIMKHNPDPNAYIPIEDLSIGKYWSMGIATVSESKSKGAYDSTTLPGKRTNQISFVRNSYAIAGNVANARIREINFSTPETGNITMYTDMVEWEKNLKWKKYQEEWYWNSEYNRNEAGEIVLRDPESGEPIPHGAGVKQIAKQANSTTYGLDLQLNHLKSFISNLYNGFENSDNTPDEIVAYCGEGFMEDFDLAIKRDGNDYAVAMGYEMINSSSAGLTYGAYFKGYRLPNNKIVKLVHLRLLDKGTEAVQQKKNGMIHPRTGKPICSHSAYFLDHTTYNGVKNIQMYTQKGRAIIRGVVKGLSPLPTGWGNIKNDSLATDMDQSSIHYFSAKGINIRNEEHCGFIECVLD